MITYTEFKRAFSQLDVSELFSGDGLSISDQEVLFEELKERVLAKLSKYDLTDVDKKGVLFELMYLELKKRHANTMEYQVLVDTEQRIMSMLERRSSVKKEPVSITVTPYTNTIRLDKYI